MNKDARCVRSSTCSYRSPSLSSVTLMRGWRIDRANRADNIDAVIALAMAVERADQPRESVNVLGWI